jgi:acetyl-CoA synthetase
MSTIESVLQETRVFPPPADMVAKANISGMAAYQALCKEAERDFEAFEAREASRELLWHKLFTEDTDESQAPIFNA